LVAEGITLEMLGHSVREQFREKKRPPVWFLRVIEKLNDEFAANFTLEQLATEASVHPVHLAKVFRQFQRQTIGEYQQKLRVSRAIQLLRDRKIPLSEIAISVGFFDQSHFTRVFKRHLGLTPAVFRQSLV
jgi:AraC family transcriptional regulator